MICHSAGCWQRPGVKPLAFASLVAIQVSTGIVYKMASRTGRTRYAFSTTSAVGIAELLKCLLSAGSLLMECRLGGTDADGSCQTSLVSRLRKQLVVRLGRLSWGAFLHIQMLALLYTVNNQLSMFIYLQADPGTVYLFKAGATILVALSQRCLLGRRFSDIQWVALCIQVCGIVVVQYDPCAQSTVHSPHVYVLLVMSTLITAVCTVDNEYLVKHYDIPLNAQNLVLYAGGFAMNVTAFFVVPNPNADKRGIGFFEGYDSWGAVGVIVTNALIGLAINAVYKYADAVTKVLATDTSTATLMAVSIVFFGFPGTLVTWVGIVVVLSAVHLNIRSDRYVLKEDFAPRPAAGARPSAAAFAPAVAGVVDGGSGERGADVFAVAPSAEAVSLRRRTRP
eukprot:TRINITY_DN51375_c0_g1_i1.p1 TRINITY_DN51375_c0_g1~~TRINITY_DN51375_c0_g1_i1.p1  ORF type:complete len:395 (-),score=74.05 TRINITY_DN51375_c0_g1_i1:110-1294(-)